MWMIRNSDATFCEEFIRRNLVVIGWGDAGNPDSLSREGLSTTMRIAYPDWGTGRIRSSVGQVFRFYNEMQQNDWVVTYDRDRRIYHLGQICSNASFDPSIFPDTGFNNIRNVIWQYEIRRDDLSPSAKNSLGSTLTVFYIPDDISAELLSFIDDNSSSSDEGPPTLPPTVQAEEITEEEVFADLVQRTREFIKDKVAGLSWEELEELVAGILRGRGFKTSLTERGADRGKDIVASPDGLGFCSPRIVVEVKHRINTQINSQHIRSFVGGRHKDDRGLYVSTGGFSKDAKYEADRANIQMSLMNLDDLVDAYIESYDSLDVETRSLVPLKKFYVPIV